MPCRETCRVFLMEEYMSRIITGEQVSNGHPDNITITHPSPGLKS